MFLHLKSRCVIFMENHVVFVLIKRITSTFAHSSWTWGKDGGYNDDGLWSHHPAYDIVMVNVNVDVDALSRNFIPPTF